MSAESEASSPGFSIPWLWFPGTPSLFLLPGFNFTFLRLNGGRHQRLLLVKGKKPGSSAGLELGVQAILTTSTAWSGPPSAPCLSLKSQMLSRGEQERLPSSHLHSHLRPGPQPPTLDGGSLVAKLLGIATVEPLWALAQFWGAGLECGTPSYLLLENREEIGTKALASSFWELRGKKGGIFMA